MYLLVRLDDSVLLNLDVGVESYIEKKTVSIMRQRDQKVIDGWNPKMVQQLGREEDIDHKHFIEMVDTAIATINKYGDFEWFVSDDPYVKPPLIVGDYGLHPFYED